MPRLLRHKIAFASTSKRTSMNIEQSMANKTEKENKFIRLATDEINIICEKLVSFVASSLVFGSWLHGFLYALAHFYSVHVFMCVQIVFIVFVKLPSTCIAVSYRKHWKCKITCCFIALGHLQFLLHINVSTLECLSVLYAIQRDRRRERKE